MSCFGSLNSCTSTAGATSGGSLAQLIALGSADKHLTSNPDVTYWRVRIQKCTNFAMESILQNFQSATTFGTEISATLNRTGDLVYFLYVLIDIPAIAAQAVPSGTLMPTCNPFPCLNLCDPCDDGPEEGQCTDYPNGDGDVFDTDDNFDDFDEIDDCSGLVRPYCHWVNAIGFAAVSRASFSIGGQIIDTVYSHYMFMWEELSGQPGKRLTEMIGKRHTIAQLVADSQFDRRLYVPLPFYFTQHSGNALPLVSLQFHSVQVQVCFADLSKLIQTSDCNVQVMKCCSGTPITPQDMNAMLDITYVYLDMEERDRFAVGSFQQLITQVQEYSCTTNNARVTAQLNFNHPVLEMFWAVQRKCQADANNTFVYSGYKGRDPVRRATLRLNNLCRFDREGPYFRMVQPYQFHTLIPTEFIYDYSFALHPESCQPSGSLNMSRIDNTDLTLCLQSELAGKENAVYVFARNFNILRFKEGLGGLLYSN